MKYLVFLFLLISCTPQKKLQRLIKKHPELLKPDTIIVTDTVRLITPRTQIDTFYSVKQLIDTIRIEKNNLKVLTYLKNDTIYLDAECDTIVVEKIRELKIPYEKIDPEKFYNKKWFLIILVFIFVALCIRYLLAKP